MDSILVSVTSGTIVGGYIQAADVSDSTGYNSSYTTGLYNDFGNSDYSFAVFDLDTIPPYALTALEAGTLQADLNFTTSTGSIIGRTLNAYVGDELPAVSTQITDPSAQNAYTVDIELNAAAENLTQVASISVKKGVPPLSSSQNENAEQIVPISSDLVDSLYDNGPDLMVAFGNTGDASITTVDISSLSITLSGVISVPDVVANDGPSIVTGTIPFAPFAALAISSGLPAQFQPGAPLIIQSQNAGASQTTFLDDSTAISGTNFYEIVQSNAAAGTLSGAGLMLLPAPSQGQAAYQIAGTTAQIAAELQALVFTPSVSSSGQAAATTFTLEEFNAPAGPGGVPEPLANGVITYTGNSDANDSVKKGTSAVVLSGGTTSSNLVIGTETVENRGTADATGVDGGTLDVQAGGESVSALVDGTEIVQAGGLSSKSTVGAGSVEDVLAGGQSRGPVIESGGVAEIYGSVSNAVIDSVTESGFSSDGDGRMTVYANGLADNTTVESGGILTVDATGKADGVTAAGDVTVASGGQLNQLTIAGGTVIAETGALLGGTITFTASGGTFQTDTPFTSGTKNYQNIIAGFTGSAAIDLTGLHYVSASSTATLTGNHLTISNGTASEVFNLEGSSATAFEVENDGGGGTLVTPEITNPDSGEHAAALPPLIAGEGTVMAGAHTTPFASAQISDPNPGSADTLTIQISGNGASGTLSGPELNGGTDGSYSLSGTASAITAELQQIQFTPAAQQPNSAIAVSFTLTDQTTAGTSASNAGFVVTVDTPATAPVIGGSSAQTVTSASPVAPFAAATVTDPNVNSSDVLTIQLGGAGGALSGTGLTGGTDGAYTLSGTAAQVTAALQALMFTPASDTTGNAATTTFTLTDTTTPGTTATDAAFSVTYSDPAVAPAVTASLVSDTGSSSSDGITSDAALDGSADPNAIVSILDNTTVLGTTTAAADGSWSYMPTLSDGTYTLIASETNASGITGQASVGFTLDTAPDLMAVAQTSALEQGQMTILGVVTAGLNHDALTLTQTSGTGALSLGAVRPDGTQQVIYAAPATVVAALLDEVGYTVSDALDGVTDTGSAAVQLDPGPTLSSVEPAVVEASQTTVVGVATPGLSGDTLTLTQTGGTGTVALGAAQPDGTQQVIYTAPAAVAAGVEDAVSYTVTDQLDGVAAIGAADVQLETACYTLGTRIATARGAVPIEELRPGDLVRTLTGGSAAPVVWLGHRQTRCDRHPNPAAVMPVRVRRGAFGAEQPIRDLVLSPDHAVFTEGVLIPVRYLINGKTVVQENVAEVGYWHVELSRHAVILAEGLPAESWLDTGNRSAFANGGSALQLHPDFAAQAWRASGCAALVTEGTLLNRARETLAARALALGMPVPSEHRMTLAASGVSRVVLAPNTELVRLLSPAGQIGGDRRRLGVAINALQIDGKPVSLDDALLAAGFHQLEGHAADRWRWTDGAALLQLPPCAYEKVLEVGVVASFQQAA